MLTRIEIDGFKTFEDFSVDLRPLAVVLGGNAVGKSNLFDAIRFVSSLATGPVIEACLAQRRGLPFELFSFDAGGRPRDMLTLAVEVLLEPTARDDLGDEVEIKHRRLRWEVSLSRVVLDGVERIVVTGERASSIGKKGRPFPVWGPAASRAFAGAYLPGAAPRDFLTSESRTADDGRPGMNVRVKQDGHQGRDRVSAAAATTVLSTITTAAEFPHLFALRQELASWRFLHLDPGEMREPALHHRSERLDPSGRNLAASLFHLQQRTKSDVRPHGVLPDIAAELGRIVPGVTGLSVTSDADAREFRVDVHLGPSRQSARLVSDGTLRLIGLFSQLYDPAFRGLLYLEEPENGIHPERLAGLMRALRDRVSALDVDELPSPAPPLRQVLLNSHSPVVLSALQHTQGEVFFAETVSRAGGPGRVRRTLLRPVQGGGTDALGGEWSVVARHEVDRYLRTVQGGV